MEKLRISLLAMGIVLVFITGYLANYALNSVYVDIEKPFLVGIKNFKEQPNNWIQEEDIDLFEDKVVIYVNNPIISKYASTGSMLPTLGENTNGISIVPESAEQINIGDIITYRKNGMLIVHRVVAKGEDNKGIYFIVKGDNNLETDGKVYFKDIKHVTIALVY